MDIARVARNLPKHKRIRPRGEAFNLKLGKGVIFSLKAGAQLQNSRAILILSNKCSPVLVTAVAKAHGYKLIPGELLRGDIPSIHKGNKLGMQRAKDKNISNDQNHCGSTKGQCRLL